MFCKILPYFVNYKETITFLFLLFKRPLRTFLTLYFSKRFYGISPTHSLTYVFLYVIVIIYFITLFLSKILSVLLYVTLESSSTSVCPLCPHSYVITLRYVTLRYSTFFLSRGFTEHLIYRASSLLLCVTSLFCNSFYGFLLTFLLRMTLRKAIRLLFSSGFCRTTHFTYTLSCHGSIFTLNSRLHFTLLYIACPPPSSQQL